MNKSCWLWLLFIPVGSLCQDKIVAQTWEQTNQTKNGTLTIYWYESRPFIFRNDKNELVGIELEIIEGFKKYIKTNYNTDIKINWIEAKDFGNTYNLIRDQKIPGTFATSAFSIVPERLAEVAFSPPYMSDICVLISSDNIPIAETLNEFNQLFSKLTAITIRQTTYEKDLIRLQENENIPFKIEYISSEQNILRHIAGRDNAFGFIDLPIYMMMFNDDPSVNVKRQNFFPINREGYGIIFPKGSDWKKPIDEYFRTENFKAGFQKIIGHYLDPELYFFVEGLAKQSNTPIALLTKEKEIQSKDLISKTEQIERETKTRNILTILIAIVFVSLVAIIMLYRKKNEQKEKIESQQQNIELKNALLEKRNEHLIAINEEKNNLIKILAHDLRAPINHVQGLAQVILLSAESLNEEEKKMMHQIMDASIRLNKMIANLLDIDAIENDRVKMVIDQVNIYSIIHDIVKSFQKQAKQKAITFHFSVNTDNALVKGDSLYLIEVFENLISNALKFSEHGKNIFIDIQNLSDKVQINIKDEGPGLTPDDLEMLFKKFQRLSARPTAGESSLGLGLSIVKKYVELMGGKVWCESEQGKGASFIVNFEKPDLP